MTLTPEGIRTVARVVANILRRYPNEIDDGIQEALIAVWLCDVEPEDANKYVIAIAANKAKRIRKRLSQSPETSLDDLTEEAITGETSVEVRTSAALDRAIEALPPRRRQIVTMHYLEGLGTKRIAHLLGITRMSVVSALRRAIKQLRDTYSHG